MSGQSANLSLKEAKAMQERICMKSSGGSSSKAPKAPKMSDKKMKKMQKYS